MSQDRIDHLRKLAETYKDLHEQGGYRPRSIAMRSYQLEDFFMFLEGKWNPATDKSKMRRE